MRYDICVLIGIVRHVFVSKLPTRPWISPQIMYVGVNMHVHRHTHVDTPVCVQFPDIGSPPHWSLLSPKCREASDSHSHNFSIANWFYDNLPRPLLGVCISIYTLQRTWGDLRALRHNLTDSWVTFGKEMRLSSNSVTKHTSHCYQN